MEEVRLTLSNCLINMSAPWTPGGLGGMMNVLNDQITLLEMQINSSKQLCEELPQRITMMNLLLNELREIATRKTETQNALSSRMEATSGESQF